MTDYMTLQSALRSRAEVLKGVEESAAGMRRDGDMMYEAADYIARLERDKSRLVEEVATVTRARDTEIRCRLDNAHLLTEIAEKLAAARADRDEWKARATQYDTPKRPRYFVDPVLAPGPTGHRMDKRWHYHVRDFATPSTILVHAYKSAAMSVDQATAERICAMLNAEAAS